MNSPQWFSDRIWYQIFPERFRNGNSSINPTIEDIRGAYPHDLKSPFQIHPWNSDWYKLQPYEKKNGRDIWFNLQRRRYGGDLQGIIDKIPYLKELGINGIYLNPIFDAPSSHKYDGRLYHHIDPTLGPDPIGDKKMMESEDFLDPSTWKWTSADRLILKLIEELHRNDIKIIFDGVFNHMGIDSIPFRDILKYKKDSKFIDWFTISRFGRGKNPLRGWRYESWKGFKELPALKQNGEGLIEPIRNYIFSAVKRWMKPDMGEGIDGWRLDVASCIAHPFWKKFRNYVKKLNGEAILIGEIFGDEEFLKPYLMGDEFDGIMNYNLALYLIWFVVERRLNPSEFIKKVKKLLDSFPKEISFSMQNLLGSHDTNRMLSHILNRGRFKYENWSEYGSLSGGGNNKYNTGKPGKIEIDILKKLLLLQFTMVGSPMIYYGDEVGMWGANDPCCRKPMVWDDIEYENESIMPDGSKYPMENIVSQNRELLLFYKKLISVRKRYRSLNHGEIEFLTVDDEDKLLLFCRKYGREIIYIAINLSKTAKKIDLPINGERVIDCMSEEVIKLENGGFFLDGDMVRILSAGGV